nr:Bd3614 family nucleic acid deaminase [Pseudomonas toyotomiensis]
MYDDNEIRQIMSSVQRQMCTSEVACCFLLESPQNIYMCNAYEGWPAVTNLIQGVSRLTGKRFKKIYLMHTPDSRPTPMCQGMIDYLCTWDEFNIFTDCVRIFSVDDSNDVEHLNYIEIEPELVLERTQLINFGTIPTTAHPAPNTINLIHGNSTHLHRLYMALAYRTAGVRGFYLGSESWLPYYECQLYQHGHSIGAVLVSAGGTVLAKSMNTKASNITFHAEVNLIQAFIKSQNGFDQCHAEYVIYTTLKPCRMCAAMITYILPNSKIIYAQDDTGAHARNTPSPIHGTVALQALAKPLRLYDGEGHDSPKTHDNIAATLDSLRTGPSLTQSIDTSYAGRQMLHASLSVARKVNKYTAAAPNNQQAANVSSVAKYLNGLMDPI